MNLDFGEIRLKSHRYQTIGLEEKNQTVGRLVFIFTTNKNKNKKNDGKCREQQTALRDRERKESSLIAVALKYFVTVVDFK